MLLGLRQDEVLWKVALRVQEIGTRSQPLSRIDTTDLALMIVSGSQMGRVLDILTDSTFGGGALPAGYGAGY